MLLQDLQVKECGRRKGYEWRPPRRVITHLFFLFWKVKKKFSRVKGMQRQLRQEYRLV